MTPQPSLMAEVPQPMPLDATVANILNLKGDLGDNE